VIVFNVLLTLLHIVLVPIFILRGLAIGIRDWVIGFDVIWGKDTKEDYL